MATTLIDKSSRAQMSDKIWFGRSTALVSPADGTYALIKMPKFAFVTNVWAKVATAFTGTTDILTVGYTGNGGAEDLSAFLSNDISVPNVAGLKKGVIDTILSVGGVYFNGGRGMITATVAAGDGTIGTFQVFVAYVQIY